MITSFSSTGPVWTLDEALALVRQLQPIMHKNGWHICLGGGVLNKGYSDKDLDLYFFPFGSGNSINIDALRRWMGLLWGEAYPLGSYKLLDNEKVFMVKEKYYINDEKRIDVFIGFERKSIWASLVGSLNLWKYGKKLMLGKMVTPTYPTDIF